MSFEDFLQELSECVGGFEPTAHTNPPAAPYITLCTAPQENLCTTDYTGFTPTQNIDTVPTPSGQLLFRVKRSDSKVYLIQKNG